MIVGTTLQVCKDCPCMFPTKVLIIILLLKECWICIHTPTLYYPTLNAFSLKYVYNNIYTLNGLLQGRINEVKKTFAFP